MAELLKGKTAAGFEYQIDPDDLNDMEFLEVIAEVDENAAKLPKLICMALGDTQKKAFYDHYRNESGKVPVDVVSAAFVEILTNSKQGKN